MERPEVGAPLPELRALSRADGRCRRGVHPGFTARLRARREAEGPEGGCPGSRVGPCKGYHPPGHFVAKACWPGSPPGSGLVLLPAPAQGIAPLLPSSGWPLLPPRPGALASQAWLEPRRAWFALEGRRNRGAALVSRADRVQGEPCQPGQHPARALPGETAGCPGPQGACSPCTHLLGRWALTPAGRWARLPLGRPPPCCYAPPPSGESCNIWEGGGARWG